ncbi:MAG: protein kinase [Pirellulaceae bacterium]|nr:protein kinase [Pirellulaceae bacterium]
MILEFPGLLNYRSLAIDLAYEEFCLHREAGRQPDPQDFCARFPDIGRSLEQQIDLHNLLEASPNLLDKCVDSLWPKEGDSFLGFVFCEEVGRGAFSRVYRAHECALGNRSVIVKLSNAFGSDEANILGRLDHPNIIPVFSVGHDKSRRLSAICMPDLGDATLVDFQKALRAGNEVLALQKVGDFGVNGSGQTLRRRLRKRILELVANLAHALDYAHSQGILHLDIKPSNVLLTRDGSPRLLDFNLSYDDGCEIQKKAGGTLPYMSPEQIESFRAKSGKALSACSDVYSLGVLLFELLLQRLPFDPENGDPTAQETARVMLAKQAQGLVLTGSELEELGDDVVEVLKRSLAFHLEDRFQTAGDLCTALRKLVSNTPFTSRRQMLAYTSGVVLAIGGFGAFVAGGGRELAGVSRRRAELLIEKGSYLAAIDLLDKLVRVEPSAINIALLAYSSAMAKDHRGACHWYNEALKMAPTCSPLLNNLGYSYFRQGFREQARVALGDAIQLNATLQPALHNRAIVGYALVEGEEVVPAGAMADIQVAISLGDPSMELFRDAAVIHAKAAEVDSYYAEIARHYVLLALRAGVDPRKLTQCSRIRGIVSLIQESEVVRLQRSLIPERARLIIAPPFQLKG